MKGIELRVSCVIPTEVSIFSLSPDGRHFITYSNGKINLYNTFTLDIIRCFNEAQVQICEFSQDSKVFAYITNDRLVIVSDNKLEINLESNIKIKNIIWNRTSETVACPSEMEIHTAVYSVRKHKFIKVDGCSEDKFGNPMCLFSPNGDYLCIIKKGNCIFYCNETWTCFRVKCEVFPIIAKFVSPFVVAMSSSNGNFSYFSILSGKLVGCYKNLPSESIQNISLSPNGLVFGCTSYEGKLLLFESISITKIYDSNALIANEFWIVVNEELIKTKPFQIHKISQIKEEYIAKTKSFLLSFKNDYELASYDPSCPGLVFIWDLCYENPLKAVLDMKEKVRDLNWSFRNLVIVCKSQIVVLSHSSGLVIKAKQGIKYKSVGKMIGAIHSTNEIQFVNFSQ